MDTQPVSRKVILTVCALCLILISSCITRKNVRTMTTSIETLMQGIPVTDSFESWLRYIDESRYFVKDSLVDQYRLYFHVDAGKQKQFFPREEKLNMSVYRIHYIDTVNKHNAYSQVAVEAIIYFDNDSAGIKKLEAQKVALESFLRSSFYNVKEQKSVNHPEIVFLLAGPKKNGWVFVTKQMDKKRNAYYLKVMYRITSYQYRKF